jgi:hypothetical protein
VVWLGTRHTDWECGRLGRVPHIRIGNVDGLERCPEHELGCGRYLAYGLGMWIAWKGTSCTKWECGWFGKVPGVWFGLWSVPGVQNGIVNGLEMFLVYGLGLWMVCKGA